MPSSLPARFFLLQSDTSHLAESCGYFPPPRSTGGKQADRGVTGPQPGPGMTQCPFCGTGTSSPCLGTWGVGVDMVRLSLPEEPPVLFMYNHRRPLQH